MKTILGESDSQPDLICLHDGFCIFVNILSSKESLKKMIVTLGIIERIRITY